MQERKLRKQFDKDGDHQLNKEERQAARDFLKREEAEGRGQRRRRFGPRNDDQEAPRAGQPVKPGDAKSFGDAPLYEMSAVRTFFLEFEDADWEKELSEFKMTDVEVPAKLTVDGKVYPDVGVRFRGMSSFMMVGDGRKRSFNLSLDSVHKEQNFGGYRTINLLNSHEDPTFLRSILSYEIARAYIPAPKANFAKVAVNGENWGVYVNVEQFNKDFINEWFGTTKGARWKVKGSPRGRGNLTYLGDTADDYKKIYDLKTKEDPKAWADLIRLCKVLNETPSEKLEETLKPILDIDGTLKFLALQNALINNDGYWIRTSDYCLYQDVNGRFHIIPQDSNENFLKPERPGGFGGPRRNGPGAQGAPDERRPRESSGGPGGENETRGVELDPLIGIKDAEKPLISKLLAVPTLRARYLGYVRDIAEKWLDWNKLGPLASKYQALIAEDIKSDTRKLDRTEDFTKNVTEDLEGRGGGFGPGGRGTISLKNFATQRRTYLLNYREK
jgi:hypothetical protein